MAYALEHIRRSRLLWLGAFPGKKHFASCRGSASQCDCCGWRAPSHCQTQHCVAIAGQSSGAVEPGLLQDFRCPMHRHWYFWCRRSRVATRC